MNKGFHGRSQNKDEIFLDLVLRACLHHNYSSAAVSHFFKAYWPVVEVLVLASNSTRDDTSY